MIKKEIVVVLDNVRSVLNAGAIFRTSDAAGVSKIYLCGYTPTPIDRFNRARKDFAKTALGAEKSVAWEYKKRTTDALRKLKNEGFEIIAIELDKRSQDYKKIKIKNKTAIVLGNEVLGVSKNILKQADVIAEIPMMGEKESLNVSVAFGIVLFRLLNI
ncbi:MAG: TrmH family RNA methyltransferase [Minisyncoccia bacterium]